MSDYKVLAEVGQSLVNLLWENIQANPDLVALINSPNLFLSNRRPSTRRTATRRCFRFICTESRKTLTLRTVPRWKERADECASLRWRWICIT